MRAIELTRRRQVIAAWQDGVPLAEAASAAQFSVRTIRRWIAHWQATGSIEPRRPPGRPRRIPADAADEIAAMVMANPTATLTTRCQIWTHRTNVDVSTATMSRALARNGWIKRRMS